MTMPRNLVTGDTHLPPARDVRPCRGAAHPPLPRCARDARLCRWSRDSGRATAPRLWR